MSSLKIGSKGQEVSDLQLYLNIVQDGDFGPLTDSRVRAFQSEQGLVPDGIVGSITIKALHQAVKTLVLTRLECSPHGTKGELYYGSEKVCDTLELPWDDNTPMFSSIPTGRYYCEFNYSPKFKRDLYILNKVPNRTGIRIHAGTWAGDTRLGFRSDLLGCIAPGSGFMLDDNGQLMITKSVYSLEKLYGVTGKKGFVLVVK
jgi:hypothetical protein